MSSSLNKFSSKVKERIKFYFYLYIDPRNNEIFYIGKGKDNRCFSHLKDESESEKVERSSALSKLGIEPKIELLKYGLNEKESFLVEQTAIDLLKVETLTNKTRDHGTSLDGRASVEEVVASCEAKLAKISHRVILINVSRRFRYGLTPMELYDYTRCCWKVGRKREQAEFALSVFRGIVREVYKMVLGCQGGTTMRSTGPEHRGNPERWEFVGTVADETIRKKYLGKSVREYLKIGAQNPIMYVNCN